jgi:anti-sigma factor RsiW
MHELQTTDTCRAERERLSRQLDERLPPLDRLRLERHLRRCSDCRAFAALLTDVTAAVRAAPLERPARSFELPRRAPRRVPQWAAALAAAACVALVTINLQDSSAPIPGWLSSPPKSIDDHAREPSSVIYVPALPYLPNHF